MKQRIINKGKGWYIIGSNYKDSKDMAFLDLFFPKNSEPIAIPNDKGYASLLIDIEEAKFTSYKGKIGMTIFKYSMTDYADDGFQQTLTDDGRSVTGHIEDINNLPFY